MNIDESSMVLTSALSSASPDFKQPSMSPNPQIPPAYHKSSNHHAYKSYDSDNQTSRPVFLSKQYSSKQHGSKQPLANPPSSTQLSAKQMSDELQRRFSYQRAPKNKNGSQPSAQDTQKPTCHKSHQSTKPSNTGNSSKHSQPIQEQQTAPVQSQAHHRQSSQDMKHSRQCLGALDSINLPSDSYQQIPERRFMSSLLKHTGIALLIIVSLAAISVYAAEADSTYTDSTYKSNNHGYYLVK